MAVSKQHLRATVTRAGKPPRQIAFPGSEDPAWAVGAAARAAMGPRAKEATPATLGPDGVWRGEFEAPNGAPAMVEVAMAEGGRRVAEEAYDNAWFGLRQPHPTPDELADAPRVTYARLPDGGWGVRGQGLAHLIAVVAVKRDGTEKPERVHVVIKTFEDGTQLASLCTHTMAANG